MATTRKEKKNYYLIRYKKEEEKHTKGIQPLIPASPSELGVDGS
jgi:hypothetical protein